ncbi:hypothetical protein DPX16_21831 [Anabarilius grahami]|uniref:Gypsy retrotransposon integrase-like protein 1 n=1 Tax=Anabarilius grahami TaxID=495550 RepID=A0A3N0YQ63_ANAGA|nr:hypothetical protein DPX16_21831 [Anabarilius grahami]
MSLQVLVPVSLKNEVLQACHNPAQAGHVGEEKTLTRLRRRYHWTAEVTRGAKGTSEFVQELQANLQQAHQVARQNLHSAQTRQKKVNDLRAREKSYQVGDLMLVRVSSGKKGYSPKLQAPWQGPFVVTACLGPVLYRVRDRRSEKVLHHDRLQPYLSDHIPAWMQRLRCKYTCTEEDSQVPITAQVPVAIEAEVPNPTSSDNTVSE